MCRGIRVTRPPRHVREVAYLVGLSPASANISLDTDMSTIPANPAILTTTPLSSAPLSIYADIPWGVVIVLGIIALVILATIWMVTGSSGE